MDGDSQLLTPVGVVTVKVVLRVFNLLLIMQVTLDKV